MMAIAEHSASPNVRGRPAVEAQLLAGEDGRSAPNAESVASEVVAFANADGVALFPRCAAMLGVNDHAPFGTRRGGRGACGYCVRFVELFAGHGGVG